MEKVRTYFLYGFALSYKHTEAGRDALMDQNERRRWLIEELLKEKPEYAAIEIPENESEQKRLLRALFNVRPPGFAGTQFLQVQDEYLQEETRRKGITPTEDLIPVSPSLPDISLWQGDITTLKCDAIVNAANDQMLGCFYQL